MKEKRLAFFLFAETIQDFVVSLLSCVLAAQEVHFAATCVVGQQMKRASMAPISSRSSPSPLATWREEQPAQDSCSSTEAGRVHRLLGCSTVAQKRGKPL